MLSTGLWGLVGGVNNPLLGCVCNTAWVAVLYELWGTWLLNFYHFIIIQIFATITLGSLVVCNPTVFFYHAKLLDI